MTNYSMTIEATFNTEGKIKTEVSGSIEFINEFTKNLQKVIGYNGGSIDKMTPNQELIDFLTDGFLKQIERDMQSNMMA